VPGSAQVTRVMPTAGDMTRVMLRRRLVPCRQNGRRNSQAQIYTSIQTTARDVVEHYYSDFNAVRQMA
jgi:hypothetical protein